MRRLLVLLFIVALFVIITVSDGSALTFELNKDKPGVQAFIQKNLRFTVGGAPIIQKLPANFYVIYYSPDDIPVLAAKVGKIEKTSPLSPYLEKLSGGNNSKSITGPHKEKIVYNPNSPTDKKILESYALWDGWIFIGHKKETINNLLKLYKTTSDIVKIDKSATSIKGWKDAGIKIWGDNSNNHLYNIFEAQKERLLIPLVKDPKKIQYLAGAFTLTVSNEMNGTLLVKPVNPQAKKDIEGDLRFIGETVRRRLVAVKTPYKGKLYSTDNAVIYEAYMGNYLTAQGEIIKSE